MKLKKLRNQNNLTQEEFAKIMNITQFTYCNYEKGKTQAPIDVLCKIADYYGVTVDYLIDHEAKGFIDLSTFSDIKKGCIYLLSKLNDKDSAVVFGYITHLIQDKSN